MKIRWMSAWAVGFAAASVWAFCPTDCPHAKKAAEAATASASSEKGGCGHKEIATATAGASAKKSGCCKEKGKGMVESVLASMPSIQYQVGEEVVACPNAAKAMASKNGAGALKYRVGDESFDNEPAATVRLASALEQRLGDLQSMQFSVAGETCYCPMRAKELSQKANTTIAYRVGGFDFTDREKAEKAMKLASEAVTQVQTVCKLGERTVECAKVDANPTEKVVYVVGENQVDSKDAATVLALQAKIRKVVETAAAVMSA
jgi:hypothetical protein